jgi:hypothetical protein
VSVNAWNNSSPFNQTVLYGERPASWRRKRFINASRAQQCWSSILPPLRCSACLSTLDGSHQAFPNPFRCGDAGGLRGGFNSRPAFVVHAEDAFGSLPCGGSPATALRFLRCFHGPIIWGYTKYATLYFVYRQVNRDSLEYTEQLGVMPQQKTPPKPCRASTGQRTTRRLAPDCSH